MLLHTSLYSTLPYPQKFVLFYLLISLPFSFQQSCESFSGVKVHDYALPGYSFASFNTRDSFSCAHRCLSHDQCKSYNYALSGAQQGLCELNSAGRDASKPLHYRPGFVFVEAVLKQKMPCLQATPSKTILQEMPTKTIPEASPSKTILQITPSNIAPQASSSMSIAQVASFKSCFDHWNNGKRVSGKYRICPSNITFFDVHCDFASESDWVWTLVMSQSHANRAMTKFKSTPFFTNAPENEDNPNWEAYRLSLEKMKDLKSQSTHWRATCSFPAHGVDYTDYVRAKFTEFDPLTFEGGQICKKVEYMNVRGHNCNGCTSAWWQYSHVFLHHDCSYNGCEFGNSPGFVYSEDNFGYYRYTNPNFRCSSSDNANTNHWFGRRI